jgi:hypothetical protein
MVLHQKQEKTHTSNLGHYFLVIYPVAESCVDPIIPGLLSSSRQWPGKYFHTLLAPAEIKGKIIPYPSSNNIWQHRETPFTSIGSTNRDPMRDKLEPEHQAERDKG